jgi:hypothetical protein
MNMALMIEPSDRAQSKKNILKFQINFSWQKLLKIYPSLNCGSKICEVASKTSYLSKKYLKAKEEEWWKLKYLTIAKI